MRKMIVALLILISAGSVRGAEPLDIYIETALRNNLQLRQAEYSLERSQAGLKQARGAFLPSMTLSARYTRAGGGRDIVFPVGDLVNPIYRTLNQLTGQELFDPTLANETIPFLREEEQDTRFEIRQPLFQPALIYNYRVRASLRDVAEAGRDQYARELIASVKKAYFGYLQAAEVVELLDSTETLLLENLRVSERLLVNGKATKEVVYRAEAELSVLRQQQAEADRNVELARSGFNFLLKCPLDSAIEAPVSSGPDLTAVAGPELSISTALNNREEIRQVESLVNVAAGGVGLALSRFLPGLSLAFDYGFEGEDYDFSSDRDFWMASLVLEWNLFNGLQDHARLRQAKLDRRTRELQLEQLRRQVRIEVRDAYQDVVVSDRNLQAASDRVRSSRMAFEVVARKYDEGMASQLEYLDARNAMTQAEVNAIVARYDCLSARAEYERVTAAGSIRIGGNENE
jgi:outer membrane protein TolC